MRALPGGIPIKRRYKVLVALALTCKAMYRRMAPQIRWVRKICLVRHAYKKWRRYSWMNAIPFWRWGFRHVTEKWLDTAGDQPTLYQFTYNGTGCGSHLQVHRMVVEKDEIHPSKPQQCRFNLSRHRYCMIAPQYVVLDEVRCSEDMIASYTLHFGTSLHMVSDLQNLYLPVHYAPYTAVDLFIHFKVSVRGRRVALYFLCFTADDDTVWNMWKQVADNRMGLLVPLDKTTNSVVSGGHFFLEPSQIFWVE